MQYRLDIQGLRALAVLSVFLFHLNKIYLPGGFIGVDVFFVISGFLISGIIFRKKEKDDFSFKDFYISRIKRIVPAYYVMIIFALIGVIFIFMHVDALLFRRSAFWSALFLSNNYFSTLDTYFGAASSENPLLHTWTLAIEMQFYLFLPIVIVLFSKKNLKYLLGILIIGLLAYCQYNLVFNEDKNGMYFSLLARIPEFLLGVSLNLISEERRKYFNNNFCSIIGLLLIVGSLFFISENSAFPGLLSLLPCIGTWLVDTIRTKCH